MQTAGECDGEDGTVRENAGQPRVDGVWYGTRETVAQIRGLPRICIMDSKDAMSIKVMPESR